MRWKKQSKRDRVNTFTYVLKTYIKYLCCFVLFGLILILSAAFIRYRYEATRCEKTTEIVELEVTDTIDWGIGFSYYIIVVNDGGNEIEFYVEKEEFSAVNKGDWLEVCKTKITDKKDGNLHRVEYIYKKHFGIIRKE